MSHIHKTIRILLVTANPLPTSRLDIEREMRAIQKTIQASPGRNTVELEYTLAAQPDDLLEALLRYEPHSVHFSSHGRKTGEILLRGNTPNDVSPAHPTR